MKSKSEINEMIDELLKLQNEILEKIESGNDDSILLSNLASLEARANTLEWVLETNKMNIRRS